MNRRKFLAVIVPTIAVIGCISKPRKRLAAPPNPRVKFIESSNSDIRIERSYNDGKCYERLINIKTGQPASNKIECQNTSLRLTY